LKSAKKSSIKKVLSKPPSEIARLALAVTAGRTSRARRRLFPPYVSEERFLKMAGAPLRQGAFFEPFSGELTAEDLPGKVRGSAEAYIASADLACAHVFDFLGSGPVELGPEINWHRDFKSGKIWPKVPVAQLDLDDIGGGVDVKVPWELSRFQHFTAMGQAYLLTGDEKYPREFAAQIDSWLAENPVGVGVNWACAMEMSIRAVNWIWAFHFFRDSDSVSPDFWWRFFHSLFNHARFVRANLEWGLIRHNHYLSDLVGLLFLGTFFNWTKAGKRWSSFACRQLEKEMGHQVYPDGVGHEGSVPYHRLSTELFLTSLILIEQTGGSMSAGFKTRLQRMLDFIAAYTKPDGEAPLFGDADDGRLQILSPETAESINDHRYLLAAGAAVFNRPDYASAAGRFWPEAWWLLGEPGRSAFESLMEREHVHEPAPRTGGSLTGSAAFPDGGFYFMRDAENYMAIDCGPVGLRGTGGHGHNDALSFELCAAGRTLITDSGSYVYGADPDARNQFRSTRAHNVIELDDREMAELGRGHRLWTIADQAKPKCLKWETSPTYDLFVGEHYGYRRLSGGPIVRRSIYFDKKEGFWVIKDSVIGGGDHRAVLRFHFRPGAEDFLTLVPVVTEGIVEGSAESRFSPSYGIRQSAKAVEYTKVGPAPLEFITLIAPALSGSFNSAEIARRTEKAKAYLE
jgi:hypothetical protein